jgi:hypothetical protein
MKVPALFATLALASGLVLAQASPGSPSPGGNAPATASGTPAVTPTEKAAAATDKATTRKVAKKTAKKSKKAMKAKDARTMGAGPAPLETDLTAKDRRERIDAAYANWQAAQRR